MRGKFRKYLTAAVLCFSCILLFKSGYIGAYEAGRTQKEQSEREMDEVREGLIDCNSSNGRELKIYLNGKFYIAVDVIFLVILMFFMFMLVLERG